MIPSTGMTSPARTRMTSPTATCSIGMSAIVESTTMGNSRSAIDQGLQVPLGPGDGEVLQHIAAGIHHGHNDPGKIFAKRESGGHRDKSDGIDPQAPRQEVADHGDEQTDNNGRGSRSPNPICEITSTYGPREQAQTQSTERGDNQGSSKESAL